MMHWKEVKEGWVVMHMDTIGLHTTQPTFLLSRHWEDWIDRIGGKDTTARRSLDTTDCCSIFT
jgi:hypothetical protein